MQRREAAVALLARVLLSYFFIWEGWLAILGYAGVADYMRSYGVPAFLLPLVILAELGGGALVLAGFLTRLAAFGLAGFSALAALFFHLDFADQMQAFHFHKNIVIAGGMLALVAFGPGDWSLDALLARRREARMGRGAAVRAAPVGPVSSRT